MTQFGKITKVQDQVDVHRFGYTVEEAQQAIEAKVRALGGAPGQARGPATRTDTGPLAFAYRQPFDNGELFWSAPGEPHWVLGAILDEYRALGACNGFLGFPVTDETAAPDATGRFSHFEHGSIYWSPATGAHEVHGAIRDKWQSLAWERGWLGYPLLGERPFTEGGAVSRFEHGSIYWWPDLGAHDLGEVRLTYRGLFCFGTTAGSGNDEPYVVFGALSVPDQDGAPRQGTARTPIYEDVDAGRSRSAAIEVLRGDPLGASLGCALMEHDEGDPDSYMGLVNKGVGLVGKGVSAGCGALFGAEAAKVCDSVWEEVGPKLASAINDVLGTGDDLIGNADLALTARQMVTLARAPRQTFHDLEYHWESPLISDGDASYKLYFSVDPV